MGRQLRTLRAGETRLSVSVTKASSTVATIPNYGVSAISTAQGTDFFMDPPVEGVTKIIYNTQATTGVLVRAGTGDVKFTSTGATVIEFDGAGDKSVTLLGLNSTAWLITAIVPVSTLLNVGSS